MTWGEHLHGLAGGKALILSGLCRIVGDRLPLGVGLYSGSSGEKGTIQAERVFSPSEFLCKPVLDCRCGCDPVNRSSLGSLHANHLQP